MAKGGIESKSPRDRFLGALENQDFYILYDLETTGLSPLGKENQPADRIIQCCANICCYNGDELEVIATKNWYINPGYALPDIIVELTGITDEFLADKPTEEEIADEIIDYFAGYPVIGYNNRPFDDVFMQELHKRRGREFCPPVSLDGYQAAKQLLTPRQVANYKQPTIAEYFGIQVDVAHTADADADTLLQIINHEIKLFQEIEPEQYMHLIPCKMTRAVSWQSQKNWRIRRIYVKTEDAGEFFFDISDCTWNLNSENDRVERYDVAGLEEQLLKATGCRTLDELCRFRGSVQVPA